MVIMAGFDGEPAVRNSPASCRRKFRIQTTSSAGTHKWGQSVATPIEEQMSGVTT